AAGMGSVLMGIVLSGVRRIGALICGTSTTVLAQALVVARLTLPRLWLRVLGARHDKPAPIPSPAIIQVYLVVAPVLGHFRRSEVTADHQGLLGFRRLIRRMVSWKAHSPLAHLE